MNPYVQLMVGFVGTSVPEALRHVVAEGPPMGVILFGRNIVSEAQVQALTRELRDLWPATAPAPIIAVDQEGGPVQRLKPPQCPGVQRIPAMRDAADRGVGGVRALGERVGGDLRRLGFDLDFAPVLDVDTNPANPIIGTRAFSADPHEVAQLGVAFAQGLHAAGVLSCGKHFPGHGDTAVDSHLALPRLDHDLARLRAIELWPFAAAAGAGLPMMMTAHILFSALDAQLPATLSPHVIPPLLRRELGYDGVVISDDLEMKAVADHFAPDALVAGCMAADVDVLLVCSDLELAAQVASELRRHGGSAEARRRIAELCALRDRLTAGVC